MVFLLFERFLVSWKQSTMLNHLFWGSKLIFVRFRSLLAGVPSKKGFVDFSLQRTKSISYKLLLYYFVGPIMLISRSLGSFAIILLYILLVSENRAVTETIAFHFFFFERKAGRSNWRVIWIVISTLPKLIIHLFVEVFFGWIFSSFNSIVNIIFHKKTAFRSLKK